MDGSILRFLLRKTFLSLLVVTGLFSCAYVPKASRPLSSAAAQYIASQTYVVGYSYVDSGRASNPLPFGFQFRLFSQGMLLVTSRAAQELAENPPRLSHPEEVMLIKHSVRGGWLFGVLSRISSPMKSWPESLFFSNQYDASLQRVDAESVLESIPPWIHFATPPLTTMKSQPGDEFVRFDRPAQAPSLREPQSIWLQHRPPSQTCLLLIPSALVQMGDGQWECRSVSGSR